MNKKYSKGTVRYLLKTNEVTAVTREVFNQRLEKKQVTQPSFFNKESFNLLVAVCDCLILQLTHRNKIDLAGSLDETLKKNKGTGWRYNQLPAITETFTKGINGIKETSALMFNTSFQQLEITQQEQVLTSIQNKTAPGETWQTVAPDLFFEELLARITEIYYSHPLALEEIGVVAMADAKGWTKIGLNNLEDREPKLTESAD